MVVVERGDVLRAKPEPDLFLACQQRMRVNVADVTVVGDAVWDLLAARRAGMLSVGLLTGGYGEDELARAGAFASTAIRPSWTPRSTSSESRPDAKKVDWPRPRPNFIDLSVVGAQHRLIPGALKK